MKKQVLFIHGAGGYEEDNKLAASLQNALGNMYQVHYPKIPDEDNPRYETWKAEIEEELTTLGSEVILVGHSLGGSMLLKYLSQERLSEERAENTVAGLFLIAAPYWGTEEWEVEYALQENFADTLPKGLPIFFYHSRDDEWVPFDHLALYSEKLPQASIREFDDRGHQFEDNLSEVAEDIAVLPFLNEG